MKIPFQIKIILGLLFITLIILSNQLFVPHFALLGIIFQEKFFAFLITFLLFILIVASIPLLLKRSGYSFYLLSVIFWALAINSFLNILAAILLYEDVAGFIIRVFGSPEYFPGFLVNQVLLFGLGIITIKMLNNKRNWFKALR